MSVMVVLRTWISPFSAPQMTSNSFALWRLPWCKKLCLRIKLQQRIRLLEEALMLARQLRFGRKSEVLSGLQRQLFEEELDTDIAATEVRLRKLLQPDDAGEKKSTSRPVRKPLPGSLPRIIKTIEPASTENCTDPECPGKLRHIRDEVSEKLEFIPAHFVVNQYVRPQYGCTCCQRVVSGETPAQIIPEGNAEASLAAQVVVSKYRDYLPLYRQQHIFARAGVDLSVSTMAGWVGAVSVALTPLAEQLRGLMLTREVIHADETSMRILDTQKGGTSIRAISGRMSVVSIPAHRSLSSNAMRGAGPNIHWRSCQNGLADILSPMTMTLINRQRKKIPG